MLPEDNFLICFRINIDNGLLAASPANSMKAGEIANLRLVTF